MAGKGKAGPAKGEGGRPKVAIDWEQYRRLCRFQATLAEIASWFSCSMDTIERAVKAEEGVTFADSYKRWSANGKVSLRRAQYKAAMKGNPAMLIWLGKQQLGQTDKLETTDATDYAELMRLASEKMT